MKNPFKNLGPGVLVAAAFIGPGTVTICTLAGAGFGTTLLWALTLSIIATAVLQETAARIGLTTGKGLAALLREEIVNPVSKYFILVLVLAAIVLGNAAYEAGNISGGVLGLQLLGWKGTAVLGGISLNLWSIILGVIAALLLLTGNYKLIERILIGLVLIMSISFVVTAILVKPNIIQIIKDAFTPRFPDGSMLTIMALIGTTVVPYNLFLHASLVTQKWKDTSDLTTARKDTYIAVILGGIVSMCIVVCASAIQQESVDGITGLTASLEPLYGVNAKYLIAIGLFAAGLTSAITAPLAAAYVVAGCLNFDGNLKNKKFKLAWMTVLIIGVIFATIGVKPIQIIQFAQVANGLLLPIIVAILIWLANRKKLLGQYTNTMVVNVISILVLLITIGLGLRSILKVFNII